MADHLVDTICHQRQQLQYLQPAVELEAESLCEQGKSFLGNCLKYLEVPERSLENRTMNRKPSIGKRPSLKAVKEGTVKIREYLRRLQTFMTLQDFLQLSGPPL